jgi:hypothetical protein
MHPARIVIEGLALGHLLVFGVMWLWNPMLAFWTAVAPHAVAAELATFLLLTAGFGAGLVGIVVRAFNQAQP